MKNIEQLNEVFTQCFLKDWKRITREDEMDLLDRRHMLNKEFKFTKEAILWLRRLNDMLTKEEDRIFKHKKEVCKHLDKWVAENVISDYEIETEIQFYNENYYKRWNQEFEGNPFFTERHYVHPEMEDDDPMVLTWQDKKTETDPVTGKTVTRYNWNDLGGYGHPLANEFYCHLLHHMIGHLRYLAWEDILRIEMIWIDLHVYHQFCIEI